MTNRNILVSKQLMKCTRVDNYMKPYNMVAWQASICD